MVCCIDKFLAELRVVEDNVRKDRDRILAGQKKQKTTRRYVNCSNRIKALLNDYVALDLWHRRQARARFLRGISYNLSDVANRRELPEPGMRSFGVWSEAFLLFH